jgi:hypothetical protein
MRISIFMLAVSVGTLCFPPKRATTRYTSPEYWFCSTVVTSKDKDQPAILYSNAIFAGAYNFDDVKRGYTAFLRKATDTAHREAAAIGIGASLEDAQKFSKEQEEAFERKYTGRPHEIRHTQWVYHPGDEKEQK